MIRQNDGKIDSIRFINAIDIDANICLSAPKPSPIQFPEGCYFKPEPNDSIRQGTIMVFHKNGLLFAELNYENDMLNGISQFYEKGVVIKTLTYINDVIEGWAMENGTEQFYKNGVIMSRLSKHPDLLDYMNEKDAKTNKIIRCCKFDDNHKPYGVGYTYENEKIKKMVLYAPNNIEAVLREFDGGDMTEYDENGSILYKGGYKMDKQYEFTRWGEGMEFKNDEVVYIGNWVNSIRSGDGRTIVNGKAHYIGKWKRGLPHGQGTLYDDKNKEVWSGEWDQGRGYVNDYEWYDYESGEKVGERTCFGLCKKKRKPAVIIIDDLISFPTPSPTPTPPPSPVPAPTPLSTSVSKKQYVVTNGTTLRNIPRYAINITVKEGTCNNLTREVVLCNYHQVQHICIEADSMKSLKSFKVRNCNALTTFETADNLRNLWNDPGSALENVPTIVISGIVLLS